MRNISTKIPITLVSVLFFVLILGFASPANAYSDKEIVDYINNNLAGASDAEIAAVASSFGVSAGDISNAYQEVSGVDVSARAEEGFEQVITVTDTVNGVEYYTAVGDSSNVYTSTNGGTSIGTFDASTGQFTNTSGATLDITTLSNVTGSVSSAGGTVTTQISGQDWNAVVGDTEAGLTYLSCAASGGAGCLATYNSGNVRTTTLSSKTGQVCTPGTTHTVNCADYVGMYGIPSNYKIGTATYSINSCNIPTFNIDGCSALGAPTITSFTATPKGFSAGTGGGPVTLSWTTLNADSCTLISDGGLSLTGDPRNITSYLIPNRVTRTATYTLTCTGPGGTTTR